MLIRGGGGEAGVRMLLEALVCCPAVCGDATAASLALREEMPVMCGT